MIYPAGRINHTDTWGKRELHIAVHLYEVKHTRNIKPVKGVDDENKIT